MDDQIRRVGLNLTNTYQFYMRDTLADNGSIPNHDAVVSRSPDIIPWGTRPSPDPLRLIEDPDWNKEFRRPLIKGMNNYIYVRGATRDNIGTGNPVHGQVNLYHARASLFLQPSQWAQNKLQNTEGKVTFAAHGNNKRVLGSDAFIFKAPDNNHHHCLVSQVITNDMPNPIPHTFPHNGSFHDWITHNPAIASHNLIVQANRMGPETYSVLFGNIDPYPANMLICLNAEGFPEGTDIRLLSQSSCLIDPISENYQTNEAGLLFAHTHALITANSEGTLHLLVTPPAGETISNGASLQIQYLSVPENGLFSINGESHSLLARHSQPLENFGLVDHEDSHLPATQLGEVTIEYWASKPASLNETDTTDANGRQ